MKARDNDIGISGYRPRDFRSRKRSFSREHPLAFDRRRPLPTSGQLLFFLSFLFIFFLFLFSRSTVCSRHKDTCPFRDSRQRLTVKSYRSSESGGIYLTAAGYNNLRYALLKLYKNLHLGVTHTRFSLRRSNLIY
ncbi:hypothetical protein P5V15_003227 [Pogonomyrmex californicus]